MGTKEKFEPAPVASARYADLRGNGWRILLLLLLALLTVWRQPGLFSSPRFWAEEGSLYFPYAYSHSFLENLFHAELGYYTLYHSIVTSFATLFPLELAPTVTTYASFLVQLGVGSLVLWGDIPLLNSRWKRATVCFIIPLICYGRNWLNTLGVHFWLGILAFLLLIEAPRNDGNRRESLRGALLALCGLTGVTACFMTPVFIFKAAVTRSRRFITYSCILAACNLIQFIVFLQAFQSKDPAIAARFVHNNPMHLLNKVLIYQFAEPFLGHMFFEQPFSIKTGEFIMNLSAKIWGVSPFSCGLEATASVAGLFMFLFLLTLFIRKINEQEYRYAIPAFLLVFILSTLFSLNMSAGPRYTFAPNAMLIVFAVSLWDNARMRVAARVLRILVCISLLIHAVEFRNSMYNLAYDETWPKWTEEVRRWRIIPGYRPRIWPMGWDTWLDK